MFLIRQPWIALSMCLLLGGGRSVRSERPNLAATPDVVTGRCTDDQIVKALEDKKTVKFLEDFGFDTKAEIWNCRVIGADWLKSGTILSLSTVPTRPDSIKQVTLLILDENPGLWLIPISSGMVGFGNVEDENHNKASLNALISSNHISPGTPETWLSLGLLYMNMTGHEIHLADWSANGRSVPGVRSRVPFLKNERLLPTVECTKEGCDVTVNDTRDVEATGLYTTWTLSFSILQDRVSLDSVVLKQGQSGHHGKPEAAGLLREFNGTSLLHESGHADPPKLIKHTTGGVSL
jgi:hypothetical protein